MAPSTKTKPVFKTTVPFTENRWPKITPVDGDNILDLLCSLLQALGDHRRIHIQPSKGKKRKRISKTNPPRTPNRDNGSPKEAEMQDATPPRPEIGSHILIGLNSVTRHLEALAAQNAPASLARSWRGEDKEKERAKQSTKQSPESTAEKNTTITDDSSPLQPLSLVIVPHAYPPASLPHAHIPTLIHLSTLPTPSNTPSETTTSPTTPSSNTTTRLVTLPPTSETRLASTLHIPHVGAVAIKEGAPGTTALVEYVREHVGLAECAWIGEAMKGEWKATKIDTGK